MVRVSFVVVFAHIAAVLGQTSSSIPTEVPSFSSTSFDAFTGSYLFDSMDDQTSAPSWAPTGSPTENGYSEKGLVIDDDVSDGDASDEDIVSGSVAVTPSVLTCTLVFLTQFLFN